jgi:hypothetical protein
MKCGTTSCSDQAVVVVHWPGQKIEMCGPCAGRARGIAEVMGFDLAITAGDPPEGFAQAARDRLGVG